MFFSSSRPAATKIIGTAGIRRSLPGSPKELVQAAKEFSGLKIGYRGDLTFRNAEVILM